MEAGNGMEGGIIQLHGAAFYGMANFFSGNCVGTVPSKQCVASEKIGAFVVLLCTNNPFF